MGEQTGESAAQVTRYIRLTNLVPELLEFIDSGRMKMQPAVELSYLDVRIVVPFFTLPSLIRQNTMTPL